MSSLRIVSGTGDFMKKVLLATCVHQEQIDSLHYTSVHTKYLLYEISCIKSCCGFQQFYLRFMFISRFSLARYDIYKPASSLVEKGGAFNLFRKEIRGAVQNNYIYKVLWRLQDFSQGAGGGQDVQEQNNIKVGKIPRAKSVFFERAVRTKNLAPP